MGWKKQKSLKFIDETNNIAQDLFLLLSLISASIYQIKVEKGV